MKKLRERILTPTLLTIAIGLAPPNLVASPIDDPGTIDASPPPSGQCFVSVDAARTCSHEAPEPGPGAPYEFAQFDNCHCTSSGPEFSGCMNTRRHWNLVQDLYTLEWNYRISEVEENQIANIHDCPLCTPPRVVTECETIRSDTSHQNGFTIGDCLSGTVYTLENDGLAKRCSFVEPMSPSDPDSPLICRSERHEYNPFPGAHEIFNGLYCCIDGDGDGAGRRGCGDPKDGSRNRQSDCDDEEPGVQRGCDLNVSYVDLEFEKDYLDELVQVGIDKDDFIANTHVVGFAERCDQTEDLNGDGYLPSESYRSGCLPIPPAPQEPAHDPEDEFPKSGMQSAIVGSDLECRVEVIPHHPLDVPRNLQNVTVRFETRDPTSHNWRLTSGGEKELNLTACDVPSREWEDPDLVRALHVCAVRYTVRTRDRGRQFRCTAAPNVDGPSDYWNKRLKKDDRFVVASSTNFYPRVRLTIRLSNIIRLGLAALLPNPKPNDYMTKENVGDLVLYTFRERAVEGTPSDIRGISIDAQAYTDVIAPQWFKKHVYFTDEAALDLETEFEVLQEPLPGGGYAPNAKILRWLEEPRGPNDPRRVTITHLQLGYTLDGASAASNLSKLTSKIRGVAWFDRSRGDVVVGSFNPTPLDRPRRFAELHPTFSLGGEQVEVRFDLQLVQLVQGSPFVAEGTRTSDHDTLGWTNVPEATIYIPFGRDLADEAQILAHEHGHVIGAAHPEKFLCDEYDPFIWAVQSGTHTRGSCPNLYPRCCTLPRGPGSCLTEEGLCPGMPYHDEDTPTPNAERGSYYSLMGGPVPLPRIYPQGDLCELRSERFGRCSQQRF